LDSKGTSGGIGRDIYQIKNGRRSGSHFSWPTTVPIEM
jgi:hypothetical protein